MGAVTSISPEKFNDYEGFVDKFKPKKTTDDCYTPPAIYDAVLNWAKNRFNISDETDIVRPFYPGGDYETYDYPEGCVVLDNPPFSTLSKIVTFYIEKDIKFFLFAPDLIFFGVAKKANAYCICNHISVGIDIEYENGAKISTSFITNMYTDDMPDAVIETAPDLYDRLNYIQNSEGFKNPKYTYPPSIVTSHMCSKYTKNGVRFIVRRSEAKHITRMDAQKPKKKVIYGSGYLLSDGATARHIAAKCEAEKNAAIRLDARESNVWELSDREKEIVKNLSLSD